MPNDFTKIFEDEFNQYQTDGYTDKIDCVVGKLDEPESFSRLDNKTQESLPAFAAWIADEIKLSPTQLRRFYTYVKAAERNASEKNGVLDSRTKAKLMFLLPKLAGSSNVKKDAEKKSIKILYRVFAVCIHTNNKIQNKKDLERFVEFFEAILDFHATQED